MTKKEKIPLEVSEIKVEKLFGLYNYNIPVNNAENIVDKLLIIYGDNGCGKTTILKLFFYLLSSRDKSGYKSRISETKFKRFVIKFKNGFEIGAYRDIADLGSFTYYISKNNKEIESVYLHANSENSIQLERGSKEDQKFLKILDYLNNLNITTFYLSDDRKILNTKTSLFYDEDQSKSYLSYLNSSDINFSKHYEAIQIKKNLNEKRLFLEPTIERLINWVQSKMIMGSREGEQNSQVIFSDIIKNYISLSESTAELSEKQAILSDISELENKLPSYVKLGLLDNIDLKIVRNSINKAKTVEQTRFLNTVVTPYIESIKVKLNALEKIEKTINLFLDTVNDYFSNKLITFHLSNGVILSQLNDKGKYEEIQFEWLSSGEKQLLLLLINAITADEATIFIIDEPEISLNIKWQRKLIKTLLKFSENKNTQFILATHSIELLSTYKNNINRLTNSINNA